MSGANEEDVVDQAGRKAIGRKKDYWSYHLTFIRCHLGVAFGFWLLVFDSVCNAGS